MSIQKPLQANNEPITIEQKRTLIATYQQTGNMTRAMREAKIKSPRTAYLFPRLVGSCLEGITEGSSTLEPVDEDAAFKSLVAQKSSRSGTQPHEYRTMGAGQCFSCRNN